MVYYIQVKWNFLSIFYIYSITRKRKKEKKKTRKRESNIRFWKLRRWVSLCSPTNYFLIRIKIRIKKRKKKKWYFINWGVTGTVNFGLNTLEILFLKDKAPLRTFPRFFCFPLEFLFKAGLAFVLLSPPLFWS